MLDGKGGLDDINYECSFSHLTFIATLKLWQKHEKEQLSESLIKSALVYVHMYDGTKTIIGYFFDEQCSAICNETFSNCDTNEVDNYWTVICQLCNATTKPARFWPGVRRSCLRSILKNF